MNKPLNLREQMPLTTAFIDQCRVAFGKETINTAIRAGMAGQKTFYASESGLEIGTQDHDFENIPNSISLDRCVLREKTELESSKGRARK
jgi:hypothetical protein